MLSSNLDCINKLFYPSKYNMNETNNVWLSFYYLPQVLGSFAGKKHLCGRKFSILIDSSFCKDV
jgi:hypothetical protein